MTSLTYVSMEIKNNNNINDIKLMCLTAINK